jgi:hypothetical protein
MSGGIHPVWSEEEVNYLLANYHVRSIKELAVDLSRSYAAVSQKLYKYRLSSTGRTLREIVHNPKIQVEVQFSNLPVFHEVMLGLYPDSMRHKRSVWKKRRNIILKMHDYQCFWCGKDADTVDHVKPRYEGGNDHPNNLVAACLACNSAHVGRVKTWTDWTPKATREVSK